MVERLGFDYFAQPPAEFRATVLSWRRYVARLLDGRVTLAQRHRLYDVAGWLSGLLAEVSLALGEETTPHCVTAVSLAREVGDRRLAGWVLGTRAQIALYTGDPLQSVTFARAARQIAPEGSAALVRACTHDARTSARIGDRHSAETALRAAEHAWSTLAEPPARSIYSFGSSYLSYCAANTFRTAQRRPASGSASRSGRRFTLRARSRSAMPKANRQSAVRSRGSTSRSRWRTMLSRRRRPPSASMHSTYAPSG